MLSAQELRGQGCPQLSAEGSCYGRAAHSLRCGALCGDSPPLVGPKYLPASLQPLLAALLWIRSVLKLRAGRNRWVVFWLFIFFFLKVSTIPGCIIGLQVPGMLQTLSRLAIVLSCKNEVRVVTKWFGLACVKGSPAVLQACQEKVLQALHVPHDQSIHGKKNPIRNRAEQRSQRSREARGTDPEGSGFL